MNPLYRPRLRGHHQSSRTLLSLCLNNTLRPLLGKAGAVILFYELHHP